MHCALLYHRYTDTASAAAALSCEGGSLLLHPSCLASSASSLPGTCQQLANTGSCGVAGRCRNCHAVVKDLINSTVLSQSVRQCSCHYWQHGKPVLLLR